MSPVKDRALDLRATSQAAKRVEYACEAHIWNDLEVLTNLFEIINAVVTFLEGDGALFSHAPLSFATTAENFTLLNIHPDIVLAVKKAFVDT